MSTKISNETKLKLKHISDFAKGKITTKEIAILFKEHLVFIWEGEDAMDCEAVSFDHADWEKVDSLVFNSRTLFGNELPELKECNTNIILYVSHYNRSDFGNGWLPKEMYELGLVEKYIEKTGSKFQINS